jgi:hypothetical protein
MCLLYVYVIRQCSNSYPFCALTYTRTCLVHCTPRARSATNIFTHVKNGDSSWGDHSLLYFAYTCVRDLVIGGVIYLAKNIIRWWYFTCKKPKNIICDGTLHVNMFYYFKIPYFTCNDLQNLPTMNILDPILYRTLFYNFRPVISPRDSFRIIYWVISTLK